MLLKPYGAEPAEEAYFAVQWSNALMQLTASCRDNSLWEPLFLRQMQSAIQELEEVVQSPFLKATCGSLAHGIQEVDGPDDFRQFLKVYQLPLRYLIQFLRRPRLLTLIEWEVTMSSRKPARLRRMPAEAPSA